jgi:hypothetical protein
MTTKAMVGTTRPGAARTTSGRKNKSLETDRGAFIVEADSNCGGPIHPTFLHQELSGGEKRQEVPGITPGLAQAAQIFEQVRFRRCPACVSLRRILELKALGICGRLQPKLLKSRRREVWCLFLIRSNRTYVRTTWLEQAADAQRMALRFLFALDAKSSGTASGRIVFWR